MGDNNLFCQVEIAIRDNAQRLYASKLKSVGRGNYLCILVFVGDCEIVMLSYLVLVLSIIATMGIVQCWASLWFLEGLGLQYVGKECFGRYCCCMIIL